MSQDSNSNSTVQFFKLSESEKSQLVLENPTIYTDFKFQWMLANHSHQLDVYKFVCQNHQYLDVKLLVLFTFNLLESKNLKAALSLQHFLLENNNSYQIPNQLWSIITDHVCKQADYLGAMFIYHELLDNHQFYEEITYGVQENNLVPFLINCSLLSQLAIVFANNEDSARLEGILRYFRRFYSFAAHSDIYQTILILLVETYSKSGNLEKALLAFKNLAFATRESSKRNTNRIKETQEKNISWRDENIQNNQYKVEFESTHTLDVHQKLLCQISQTEKYDPIIQRNVYSTSSSSLPSNATTTTATATATTTATTSITKSSNNPLISISLVNTDLPNFTNLLVEYFQANNQQYNNIHTLINFTLNSHVAISIYIVSALCQMSNPRLAFTFIKTLRNNTTKRNALRNQNFISIFDSIHRESKADYEFAQEVFNYYKNANKGHINIQVLKSYILFLLSSSFTNKADLVTYLSKLSTYNETDRHLYVTQDQHQSFQKKLESDDSNNNNYDYNDNNSYKNAFDNIIKITTCT
ncbi:hypothetical protein KGF56_000582 [Candida oxycetoniae]|uniref:Uncharacterized protein n=1 Tax=Candida oxycetoniae TaxID=497107 RepID=A0AAI9T1D1_9ASCO|nr:uncharacterized protein KGF56_000582 [Candida oxycetoniae]KAI3406451.2 hypothetical protein KGF56_000582 [Candida oxycetoniae]